MRKSMFFFALYLCFHLYIFEDSNYVKNWDDEFLLYFDFSLNPFLPKILSDISKRKVLSMLIKCISNPETFTSIDNLCQAIKHYKANKDGKTIPATQNLIEHMKKFSNFFIGVKYDFYEDVKKELQNIIKEKIENAKKKKGK